MAFKPELSVKVNIDPTIDASEFNQKVNDQVGKLKNVPPVPITPDMSKFKDSIKNNIGGPYDINLKPNFIESVKDKVDKEVEEVNKNAQKIKIVPDVENFGNDLGRAIKSQLRNVNTTLKRYVDRMTINIITLNQAATTLYSGPMFSNNNGITKSMNTSTKSVKKTVVEVQKLDKLFSTLGKDNGGYKSAEETKKLIREVSVLVENVSKAINPNGSFVQDLNSNLQNTFDEVSRLLDLKDKLAKSTNLKDDLNTVGIVVKNEKQAQNFYKLISDSENGLYKIKDVLSSLDFENLDFSDAFNSFIEASPELNKFITLWDDFSNKSSGLKISGDAKRTLTYLSQYNDVFTDLKGTDQFNVLTNGILTLTQKALELNSILEKTELLFEDKKALKAIDSNIVTKLKSSNEEITDDELGSRIIEYYQNIVDSLKTKLSFEIETLTSELSELKSPLSSTLLSFISDDSETIKKYSDYSTKEIDKLGTIKEKITEEVQKPVDFQVQQQIPSNKVAKQDIESMSNRYAEIISEIVKQQDLLNKSKLTTLALEDRLKNKTKDHLITIKNQVEEYKKLFTDFGLNDVLEDLKSKNQAKESVDGSDTSLNNGTYIVNKVKFNVDPKVLQNDVNILFKNISAPIGFAPAEGAVKNLKEKLEAGLKEVSVNATLVGGNTNDAEKQDSKKIPLQGEVKLSEEDVVPPKKAVIIPGHVTLKKEDITVLEEPVDIPGKVTLTKDNVVPPTEPVDIDGKVILDNSDVTPPIQPVDINGKVTLEVDDIKVPDKIDLNGNLVIKNASKEIKALTQLASGQKTGKGSQYQEGLKKSLTSLLKAQARIQNNLDKHSGGQEGSAEDRNYLRIINRRISTTKGKLTKSYKGKKTWQNEMWYNSAVEDADHIRNSYVGVNNDKKLVKEETELLSKFNIQVQTSVDLLNELNSIDATKTPVKYAETQKDLNESISKTRELFNDIDAKGLTGTDEYKNAISTAKSNFALNQERASNQELKDAEDQEKKNIARYKVLLKEKYSLQDKITNANKNTDTSAWEQMLSDTETEMRDLRSGFKNWFVTDELDLIEKSYKASANNKANNAKDKEQADYVKDIIGDYKVLISLQNKRTSLFKPEDSDRLKDIDDAIKRVNQDITDTFTNAKNAGFNITSNKDIKGQENEFKRVQRISDRDFNKGLADYNVAKTNKENLNIMQKLNAEYDNNINLRKELSKTDKNESPVAYGHLQDDIKKSNTEISNLRKQAKGAGLDTTDATNTFLRNAADLREKINNDQKKAIDKATNAANEKAKKQQDEWLKNTESTIKEAEKNYVDAFKAIQKEQTDLSKTSDQQTKNDINSRIAQKQSEMDDAKKVLDSYNSTANGLVQEAWGRIDYKTKGSEIQDQIAYEIKSSKEAEATKKENLDLLEKYNKALNEELKLYKDLQNADPNKNPEDYVAKQNALNDQKAKVGNLRKDIHNKGLNTSPEYQQYTIRHSEKIAAVDREVSNNAEKNQLDKINAAKKVYLDNHKAMQENLNWLDRIDPNDQNAQSLTKDYQARIAKNAANIKAAGQVLLSYNAAANDAWEEIQSVIDSTNIKNTEAANKEADALAKKNEKDAKKAASDAKKKESEENTYFRQLQQAVNRRVKAYEEFLEAKTSDPTESTPDYIAKAGRFDLADSDVGALINKGTSSGLTKDSRFSSIMEQYVKDTNAVSKANQDRIQAEAEAIKVTETDINAVKKLDKQLDAIKSRLRNAGGTDSKTYSDAVTAQAKLQELQALLNAELQNPGSNKDTIAVGWANKNGIDNVKSMGEVVKRLTDDISSLNSAADQVSSNNSFNRSITKNKTELANLQSQLYDYLKKFPAVSSGMADDVMQLQQALADPNAYNQVGRLKQSFAELRQQAKELGLETESLVDKFKNLFGQHLSTMITMAALHKMQDALRVVYQNVVEIDTAMSELRKVSNMTANEMSEYMSRAADEAVQLGVSISDFVTSTADWKRLGYSDKDSEELARVSGLMKNVGDGIDSANTAASYLISTLQGFGIAADDAQDLLDCMNQIANTEPVSMNDLGVIMQKSSAAMSAAGNTYQETLAMASALNGVLQDSDVSGTYLKTLSMYLRAAKTEASDAGIEIDTMANSVSELRSELKSLTGVDIMSDASGKNFKSTYQIMKELSEVWSSLSDVTQANVTELISGKRGGQATSALLNNFSVAEDAMKQATNSAGSALAENEVWLDSIQGRLNQLDTSFQALSQDLLKSDLIKSVVSLATALTKGADGWIKFTGAIPQVAFFGTLATQLGRPKMTGFMIVPSNTPGGDTEQVLRRRCIYNVHGCAA